MLKYKDIILEGELGDSTHSESQRVNTILQEILAEEKRVAKDLKSIIEEVGLDE